MPLAKFWPRAEGRCPREGKCASLMLRTSMVQPLLQNLCHSSQGCRGISALGLPRAANAAHGKRGSGSCWDNGFRSPSQCGGRSSLAGSTGRATGSPKPCSYCSCSILHPLLGNSAHFGNTQTNCSRQTLPLPGISQLPGAALQPEVLAMGMWPLNSKPGFAPQLPQTQNQWCLYFALHSSDG